jgi:predicted GH43/DUF377 family glycosyl hydrolase
MLVVPENQAIRRFSKQYEQINGYYKGCVFPTGNVIVDNTLYVYYGAADKYVCMATCDVKELIQYIKKGE